MANTQKVLCHLRFYKTSGGWRWQLKHGSNNKIVAASTEAYRKPSMCVKNFVFVTGCQTLPANFRLRDPVVVTVTLERQDGP